MSGKLRITFEEKPVEDVELIAIKLVNSGSRPILLEDYVRPVSFDFGRGTDLLTAEVGATEPDDLKPNPPRIEGTKIVLDPVMMNGGDSMTLRILTSRFQGKITVDGRIADVKRIGKADGTRQSVARSARMVLGGLLFGMSFFIASIISAFIASPWHWVVSILPFGLAAFILLLPDLVKVFRSR
jgi:hypothetical protein